MESYCQNRIKKWQHIFLKKLIKQNKKKKEKKNVTNFHFHYQLHIS
jgi:hypothetical protein